MVLDIDGTVVVITANCGRGHRRRIALEFDAVLDSIRIARALPNNSGESPLDPGTYYVDEVNGTPIPRIYATLDSGWYDLDRQPGWVHIAKGRLPGGTGYVAITNPDRRVLRRLPPDRWVQPGARGNRRRIHRRAHGTAGRMGRRDRPVGHLDRRLRRQSIPTHSPRGHVGLHHLGRQPKILR